MNDAVTLKNVSYTYSGGIRPALKGVNLSVRQGESLMITGPSGAGKTTLCRSLNGLIPHYFRGKLDGHVTINGVDTRASTISALSHVVGLLFQDPASQLVNPTVADEVAFGPENYGVPPEEIRARVTKTLELMRLKGYEERSPHSLSGGEQQACALAGIVAMNPNIYVLDEPTSNLDPIGSSIVLNLMADLVKQQKRTMIIVEHKMEELLPLVDRLVVLNKGEVVLEGKPRELLDHIELMEKIGLKPPQVALLASKLKAKRPDLPVPMTLDEAVTVFSKVLASSGGKSISLKQEPPQPKSEAIIEVKDLWYIYPAGTVALRGVNLTIHRGEFTGIIGQNGSGKTTLVKHFNGLLKPSKGSVVVFGVDTSGAGIADLSRRVGYCFQNPDHQVCCDTVKKELEFGPRNLLVPEDEIRKRVDEVATAVGIQDLLNVNPFSVSKGERQRITVASLLTMSPDVLVVDEPTTGQDYRMGREMMEFYKQLNERSGKTIIVITHDMNIAAEYVKRVVVLKEGQVLVDGPTREVYAKTDLLQTTYLKPPQITRLGQLLKDYGMPEDLLTVDEAVSLFEEHLGK
jgi:energy-coupling factor transporter ATP-binding protein EcfA2